LPVLGFPITPNNREYDFCIEHYSPFTVVLFAVVALYYLCLTVGGAQKA
jgi:hypothetical protein